MERFRIWREKMLHAAGFAKLVQTFTPKRKPEAVDTNKNAFLESLRAAVQTFAPVRVERAGHDGHEAYAELRRNEDGYIVEFGCRTCNEVHGFMHPRAALDLASPDSELRRQILAIWPEWDVT